MDDELTWQADRANLYRLKSLHPDYSLAQLAQALNGSKGWVKNWLRRFRQAQIHPDLNSSDPGVFVSHSRARKQPPPPPNPLIEERIFSIRDDPPDNLARTPGPRTIAYYLRSCLKTSLKAPTSITTIHKILCRNGRNFAGPHL